MHSAASQQTADYFQERKVCKDKGQEYGKGRKYPTRDNRAFNPREVSVAKSRCKETQRDALVFFHGPIKLNVGGYP